MAESTPMLVGRRWGADGWMGHGAAATMATSFYLPVQTFASEAGAEGD